MRERILTRVWRLRRGWPLLCLLLTLTLLGHDVAMAGDVHRLDPPVPQTHTAPAQTAVHPTLHPHHVPPADAPERACNIEREASRASAQDGPAPRTTDGSPPLVDARTEVLPAVLTAPPRRSPGARRALLQVFLI